MKPRFAAIALLSLLCLAHVWPANAADRYVTLFTIPNCAACPASKALAAQHGIRVVDGQQNAGMAQLWGVRVYPTWVAAQDGQVVDRYEGTPSAERLRQLMGGANPRSSPPAAGTVSDLKATTVRVLSARGFCGSGVVVGSRDGKAIVLSNEHVVNDAFHSGGKAYIGPYKVLLPDGTEHAAKLLGQSATYDLSMLLIEPGKDIPFAVLATSEPVEGDPITLCGYGGGNWRELPGKVIKYVNSRSYNDTELAVTPISIPGDSGGAIYNARGELVGVLWGGPATGPRPWGRMIHTQAIRPKTIDGWCDSKTGVLAEIFGPHSRVPKAEEKIRELEQQVAEFRELSAVQAELAAFRSELHQLSSRVQQNEAVANAARDMYRQIEPMLPQIRGMIERNLPQEEQQRFAQITAQMEARIATARAEVQAIADRKANEAIAAAATAQMEATAASHEAAAAKSLAGTAKDTALEAVKTYLSSRLQGEGRREAGLDAAAAVGSDVLGEERLARVLAALEGKEPAEPGGGGWLSMLIGAGLTLASGGGLLGLAAFFGKRAGTTIIERVVSKKNDTEE